MDRTYRTDVLVWNLDYRERIEKESGYDQPSIRIPQDRAVGWI
jgi:hypothetical protein